MQKKDPEIIATAITSFIKTPFFNFVITAVRVWKSGPIFNRNLVSSKNGETKG